MTDLKTIEETLTATAKWLGFTNWTIKVSLDPYSMDPKIAFYTTVPYSTIINSNSPKEVLTSIFEPIKNSPFIEQQLEELNTLKERVKELEKYESYYKLTKQIHRD